MPAVKEPISLVHEHSKRPNGSTLLVWANGKLKAWITDTYDESHVSNTACTAGVAAQKVARHKSKTSTCMPHFANASLLPIYNGDMAQSGH